MIDLRLSKKLFNEAFYPYLTDYSHAFEVYYGGAGSGKSVFITQKILYKYLRQKRKLLCIRKVMNSQKDSCWQLFLDILEQWKIKDRCYVNVSDFVIILPNGSTLLFKGLDDKEKIKSIAGISDIWVEEGTELTADEFDQLDLRLRSDAGDLQIFISFNPVSKANWVYKRWFAPDAEVDNDTLIIKTTYKDNRFLPEKYVERLMKMQKTNPTYYRIYALGEFCSLDKLVYTNWRVEDFDYRRIQGKLLIGLDFGFTNDPTALIAAILDEENKKIYVFREWGAAGKTNDEIAAAIKSLGFEKSLIIADAAEPKSVAELKKLGIQRIRESVKGPDSVKHGIQRLQQYELIIHPDCTETRTELENYAWKKDRQTQEYTNQPIDMFNHFLDALRYGLQCDRDDKIKIINKGIFGL